MCQSPMPSIRLYVLRLVYLNVPLFSTTRRTTFQDRFPIEADIERTGRNNALDIFNDNRVRERGGGGEREIKNSFKSKPVKRILLYLSLK